MLATQLETYKQVKQSTMSGREIEASALQKGASVLKWCQDHWEDPDREQKLREALEINQKMWTIFQADLSNPENPLPKKLREDLLSLSIFFDKRVLDVMAAPSPEKLTMLVNINLNIAAGLRGK